MSEQPDNIGIDIIDARQAAVIITITETPEGLGCDIKSSGHFPKPAVVTMLRELANRLEAAR